MSCNLIQGVAIQCRDGVSGIKEILITEFVGNESITETSGLITAMSLNPGKKFWTYNVVKEDAELVETETGSIESGTTFYDQALTFTVKKLNSHDRYGLRLLTQNRVYIIVKDNNDIYWLLGRENGCDKVGANEARTGKLMGDFGGYNVALMGKEPEPFIGVDSSIIAALKVA